MNFDKFLEIRKTYARLLPWWLDQYDKTGEMRQNPYFMDWEFTPIERNVWSDIRTAGIPFFPQLPVLNYFLDFGCPFLKIGIECDGKAWHSHDLDKARDARLAAAGWMIFRIEGHECNRMVEPGDQEEFESDEEYLAKVDKYFLSTSEGIVNAIRRRYFDDEKSNRYEHQIDATLFEHRSTPETFPVRAPFKNKSEPTLLIDCLSGYIEKIMEELRRAAA